MPLPLYGCRARAREQLQEAGAVVAEHLLRYPGYRPVTSRPYVAWRPGYLTGRERTVQSLRTVNMP